MQLLTSLFNPVRNLFQLMRFYQPEPPVRRTLDLASSVKPRERVPKPTTPMRLTDISSVQHDEDDGMDGKYIMHRWCETQRESAQAYYTYEID